MTVNSRYFHYVSHYQTLQQWPREHCDEEGEKERRYYILIIIVIVTVLLIILVIVIVIRPPKRWSLPQHYFLQTTYLTTFLTTFMTRFHPRQTLKSYCDGLSALFVYIHCPAIVNHITHDMFNTQPSDYKLHITCDAF